MGSSGSDRLGGRADGFDDALWQRRWERTHQLYLPGRDAAVDAVFDLVGLAEIASDRPLRLLDLAGGPGPLAFAAAKRFPTMSVTVADIDPALLALAASTIDRLGLRGSVDTVTVDLASPAWGDQVVGPFDVIVVMMALHWFDSDRIEAIYREALLLLRPGGLLVNIDRIPAGGHGALTAEIDELRRADRAQRVGDGAETWDQWWAAFREQPHVADLAAMRDRLFAATHGSAECHPDRRWHLGAMRRAGFAEVGEVWREHADAAVVATR